MQKRRSRSCPSRNRTHISKTKTSRLTVRRSGRVVARLRIELSFPRPERDALPMDQRAEELCARLLSEESVGGVHGCIMARANLDTRLLPLAIFRLLDEFRILEHIQHLPVVL